MSRSALALGLLLAGVVGYLLLRPDETRPVGSPEARGPHDPASSPSLHGKRAPHVPLSRIEVEADKREAEGRAPDRALRELVARIADGSELVTVRGRLLDADGSPATDGSVIWQPDLGNGRLGGAESQKVDADGSFRLRVLPAEVINIQGSSDESLRTSFARPLTPERDLGTLVLEPSLSIAGTVEAPRQPKWASTAVIHATRLDVDDGSNTATDPATVDALSDLRTSAWPPSLGSENRGGSADVDAHGQWRIAALRPGIYVVEVGYVGSPAPQRIEGTDEEWSGLSTARLHRGAQAAHRKLVRAPATDVRFELGLSLTHVVPDHPKGAGNTELMVALTDAAGRTSEVEAWYNREWEGEGDFSMVLSAGETYRLRVWANGYLPLVLEHVAPPAGEQVSIPVRLVKRPRGSLRIKPPLGREKSMPEVRVELLDRQTGERAHWEHATLAEESGAPISLSQGAWTLVVSPWDAPAALGENFDMPESRPIVVESDTEQTIRWNPPQGGRFRLQTQVPDGATRDLACQVERAGTKSRPTVVGLDVGSQAQLGWSDYLQTGRTYLAQDAYPPGEIVLHLLADGMKPQRVPVRIVAGQVTPVRVTLEPR